MGVLGLTGTIASESFEMETHCACGEHPGQAGGLISHVVPSKQDKAAQVAAPAWVGRHCACPSITRQTVSKPQRTNAHGSSRRNRLLKRNAEARERLVVRARSTFMICSLDVVINGCIQWGLIFVRERCAYKDHETSRKTSQFGNASRKVGGPAPTGMS